MELAPLARVSAGDSRKMIERVKCGATAGLPRAPSGVFYECPVGPPIDDGVNPMTMYNCYLTSFDPKTRQARNHGPIYVQDDRRMIFNAAGCISPDGESFITVGWVEVRDPARLDKVKELRMATWPVPGEMRRRQLWHYELMLVEVPLPKWLPRIQASSQGAPP
jgi:hypothetical protein